MCPCLSITKPCISEAIGQDLRELILAARNDLLGPEEERDAKKARLENGAWVGGIAAERSDQAVNIEKSERCYTWAQSYQVPRRLTGPSVGSKVVDEEITEHHELRRMSLNVRTM